MWCDADYAGLYNHDPVTSASATKSCGAFLITLSDVLLFWKMQLHSKITLSTTKAEYSTFSMSLHALLPIHDLLLEVCCALRVPHEMLAHVHCHVSQDNSASHQLANDQRLTNCTKYFLVKWHWFWAHVWCTQDDLDDPQHFLEIICCVSLLMKADYLMKGLLSKKYEVNR